MCYSVDTARLFSKHFARLSGQLIIVSRQSSVRHVNFYAKQADYTEATKLVYIFSFYNTFLLFPPCNIVGEFCLQRWPQSNAVQILFAVSSLKWDM